MNNFEKIKAMDIDEMAEFLPIAGDHCEVCIFYRTTCPQNGTSCNEVIKQWLESDVEE